MVELLTKMSQYQSELNELDKILVTEENRFSLIPKKVDLKTKISTLMLKKVILRAKQNSQ